MKVETEILTAIRRIMRAVDLHSRRLLETFGITAPQLAALQLAARSDTASASIISRELHVSRSTVTGILDRLETRGLIERRPNPRDRRGMTVSATDKGREVLEGAPSLLQERFRSELSQLAEWERSAMLANLQRIASIMDDDTLDTPARERVVANRIRQPGGNHGASH